MKTAPAIELTEKERATLVALSRGKKVSVRLAERSAIVLLAASGEQSIAIAARLKITRQKVARWRARYATQGIKGIEMDAPRSGRIPQISSASKQQVIDKTLQEKPTAATQWSRSTMAAASGLRACLKNHESRGIKPTGGVGFVSGRYISTLLRWPRMSRSRGPSGAGASTSQRCAPPPSAGAAP